MPIDLVLPLLVLALARELTAWLVALVGLWLAADAGAALELTAQP